MIYRINKINDNHFVVSDKEGSVQVFTSEKDVVYFLAGWAITSMKDGEEKLVTDVDVANCMM